jgi:hypothetical protein
MYFQENQVLSPSAFGANARSKLLLSKKVVPTAKTLVSEFSTVSTALYLNTLSDTFFPRTSSFPRGGKSWFWVRSAPEPSTRLIGGGRDPIGPNLYLSRAVEFSSKDCPMTTLGFVRIAGIETGVFSEQRLKNSWCMSNHGLYLRREIRFLPERASTGTL